MSAEAAVLAGRREAEALMVDTCDVMRPGYPVTDPETGDVSLNSDPVVSGQRCKVQQTISQASNPAVGGHQFTVQDSRIDFPVDAGPFLVDDIVVVTASAFDPQLAFRLFRIAEVFHKSFATAQRTRVEEITA